MQTSPDDSALLNILEGSLVIILSNKVEPTAQADMTAIGVRRSPQSKDSDQRDLYWIIGHGYFVTKRCIVTCAHFGLVESDKTMQNSAGNVQRFCISNGHKIAHRGRIIDVKIQYYDQDPMADCAFIGLENDYEHSQTIPLGIGCKEELESVKYISYLSQVINNYSSKEPIHIEDLHRATVPVIGRIGSARAQDRMSPAMVFYSPQNNTITNVQGTSGSPVISPDGYCIGHIKSRLLPTSQVETFVNNSGTQRGIQYLCSSEYVVRRSAGVLPHIYRPIVFRSQLHLLKNCTLTAIRIANIEKIKIAIINTKADPLLDKLAELLALSLRSHLDAFQHEAMVISVEKNDNPTYEADIVIILASKNSQGPIEYLINNRKRHAFLRFAVVTQVDVDGSGYGFLYDTNQQPFDISPSRLIKHSWDKDGPRGDTPQLLAEVVFRLQWLVINGLDLAS